MQTVEAREGLASRLEQTVSRCYEMRTRWDLKLMEAVAEVERRQFYLRDGYNSTAEWVSNYLAMGYKRAQEYVSVAIAIQELPLMAQCFTDGKLTYDHLRALTQVACPDTEADLVELTAGASVSSTWKLVNKMLEPSAEESLEARGQRWCEMRWDHDRKLLGIFAQLPEEQGARLERLIDALARKMPDDPSIEGRTPMGIKRADALAQLASENSAEGGPSATLVVHVEPSALATGRGNAEIEGGPVVCSETARMLSCDAVVQAVIHDEEGNPIGVGHTARTIPRRLRRELYRRDKGCRWPGCRRIKALHAHHIDPWPFGPTELDNLVLLCDTHHQMVHHGKYKIVGVPPKITIERGNLPPVRVGPPEFTEETAALFEWEQSVVLASARGP